MPNQRQGYVKWSYILTLTNEKNVKDQNGFRGKVKWPKIIFFLLKNL